ncbi:MAG: hypothetical protein ABWK01_03535 [Infirmifilum sp.]
MVSDSFQEDSGKVLEAVLKHGSLDVESLSRITGLSRERVELILVMLRELKVLDLEKKALACNMVCEKCPLANACPSKKLRIYSLK